MEKYEKIMFDLVARVSILEAKVSVLDDRIRELEGATAENVSSADNHEGRDKSRYSLDGNVYLKNRFVWAVVNKYVRENPDVTFERLIAIFDDKKQGSFGVVRKIKDVDMTQIPARYFGKNAQDVLHLRDGEVVVCNQWGKNNINNLVELAKSLGYKVQKV